MKPLLFPLLLLLLCGCAREVSPISALALDREGEGYRLTAELVRQDSLDDPASPSYLSATGSDLTQAIRSLENILPDELSLNHAQVLLLSEDSAQESILAMTDWLCLHRDVRLALRMAVVRDGAAHTLLQNSDEVFALAELLDRTAASGTLPDMPLYRVAEALHADGTAILPALRMDDAEQTTPAGTAVFANARLSCFLDGSEIGGSAHA